MMWAVPNVLVSRKIKNVFTTKRMRVAPSIVQPHGLLWYIVNIAKIKSNIKISNIPSWNTKANPCKSKMISIKLITTKSNIKFIIKKLILVLGIK